MPAWPVQHLKSALVMFVVSRYSKVSLPVIPGRRGVGPPPIAIDSLTEDKLVAALEYMAEPGVQQKAREIAAILKQVR